MRRFTADEMTSDPPPPPPVATFAAVDDSAPVEKTSRASTWFDNNKITRVPMIALEPDVYRVPGQAWALFSMIRPEEYKAAHHKNREYHGYLIKFRGVFPTREEAEAHIRKVMAIDRHFDVHLVPAFSWSGIDDDCVEDRQYANEMVGSILKGYFEQENSRMLGIRERIANTEMSDERGVRCDEATSFFDACQSKEAPPCLADEEACSPLELPALPRGEPISLNQIAAELDITPGGRTRGAMQLGRSAAESIVSVALLEE
jgi:hypothetical protein